MLDEGSFVLVGGLVGLGGCICIVYKWICGGSFLVVVVSVWWDEVVVAELNGFVLNSDVNVRAFYFG